MRVLPHKLDTLRVHPSDHTFSVPLPTLTLRCVCVYVFVCVHVYSLQAMDDVPDLQEAAGKLRCR